MLTDDTWRNTLRSYDFYIFYFDYNKFFKVEPISVFLYRWFCFSTFALFFLVSTYASKHLS